MSQHVAVPKKRKFIRDIWQCTCGHNEPTRAKINQHIIDCRIRMRSATKKEERRLRDADARQRMWTQMEKEAEEAEARRAAEPMEVTSLREQIETAVEKARAEGYELALLDVFARAEAMPATEPGLAVMSMIAEMLDEHRAVQSL